MSEGIVELWGHLLPASRDPVGLAILAMQALIVALQYRAAPLARYDVITYPGYKIFKQVFGTIVLFSLISRITGSTGTPTYVMVFWGVMLAYSSFEYRFLLRRSRNEVYLRVKTRKGLLDLYDRQSCNLAISVAAGIIRHMRENDVEYADYKAMQELYDAFDFPSADDQDRAIREQMRQRRETLANDKIFATEVEQIRKEMMGER